MKKAIVFILFAALFVGIGSVYQVNAIPYIVIVTVIAMTVLIAWGKVKEKFIPFYVYGLALALIWQTSMLGTYIIGADIHSEYYVVQQTIENGWNLDWINNGNYSAVLTLLSVGMAKIGISPIWQFKALFPAICALTPLILFLAFRHMFGSKRAYFASLFFMIMPMYTMEVVSMVKSQWGYPFLALLIYCMVANISLRKKVIGIVLSSAGAIFSHYTVGIVLILYLIGILLFLAVTNWGRIKRVFGNRIPLKYASLSVLLVLLIFIGYFQVVGQGKMVDTVLMVSKGATMVALSEFNQVKQEDEPIVSEPATSELPTSDTTTVEDTKIEAIDRTFNNYEEIKEHAKEITKPVNDSTYLDNQPQLVRMAIGLDFMRASPLGKLFRILQYITEIMIIVGLFILYKRRKDYKLSAMFIGGVLFSLFLLFACIFVPYFNVSTISTTRLYIITLFFLTPLLIIGIEATSERILSWIRNR